LEREQFLNIRNRGKLTEMLGNSRCQERDLWTTVVEVFHSAVWHCWLGDWKDFSSV